MKKATAVFEKLVIKTYPEPEREELPIFCENRMHQLTSGRVYPNRVVTAGAGKQAEDVTYDAVHMENDYLDLWILPQIGGRIYAATDKTNGYDFFYRNRVIKPALIGNLGSWVSGGVEFNWPFHHRSSGYAPVDCRLEECGDGSVICWVSEHDPFYRMTGTIGIVLRPDTAYIETRCRAVNRTETQHPFHWWENAAVSINDDYQFFFPKDVSHVKYHYRWDYGTWPVMGDTTFLGRNFTEPVDISWLKNSRDSVSYFAMDSAYDFFGGYDHGRRGGVVHVADHHISPGKKMFSWGWNQRERGWEKVLTDEDGAYCELMASSYTNDQPDFSWLAPYETKEFSQYWYPIREIGTPDFATLDLAVSMAQEELRLEATSELGTVHVRVEGSDGCFETDAELGTLTPVCIGWKRPAGQVHLTVTCGSRTLIDYTEPETDMLNVPEPFTDVPAAGSVSSPEELYYAGLHIEQYRDEKRMPDVFWLEALKREPDHVPSLLGMARYCYNMFRFEEALDYADRALAVQTRFNLRTADGEACYLRGMILEALGRTDEAYDSYYRAAWSQPAVAKAMTRIACLDLKRNDPAQAIRHAKWARKHDVCNPLVPAVLMIAGEEEQRCGTLPCATRAGDLSADAAAVAAEYLRDDPMNVLVRWLSGDPDFFTALSNHPAQQILDMVWELYGMGRIERALALIGEFRRQRPEEAETMVLFTEAYLEQLLGRDWTAAAAAGEKAPLGLCYPARKEEIAVLRFLRAQGCSYAAFLLGCLLYDKRHYGEAVELFRERAAAEENDYMALRSIAVGCYSHLGRPEEALSLMKKALALSRSEQILYETVVLMDMTGVRPEEKAALLEEYAGIITRSDVYMEQAKAFCQLRDAGRALEILNAREYSACEGGEAMMGTQYIFANVLRGTEAYAQGRYEEALAAFDSALVIPDSLGIGFGDEFPLIKPRFFRARTLAKLGRTLEAEEEYRRLMDIPLERFQNGGEPALPYFQACCAEYLGMPEKGQTIMNRCRKIWSDALKGEDDGFFDFTHYFVSFVQDPARKRKAKFTALLAYVELYRGHGGKAREMFAESYALDSDDLYNGFFAEYGGLFD